MTAFVELARLSLALHQTAGRLAAMERIGSFLRQLGEDETRSAVLMLLGRVHPAGAARKLEVSAATLWKAIRAMAASDDVEFNDLTQRLLALREGAAESRTVRVRPEVVLEVAYSDVQRSPQYACGYALRFARVVRIRDDRSVDDIDTVDAVEEQFRRQGVRPD